MYLANFLLYKIMTWLIISIIAYLLLGVGNLGDKLVVSRYLSSAKVYTIIVALMQAVVVVLFPFFVNWPGWKYLLIDFLAGAIFVLAIYYLYKALKEGETTRVVPTIDAFAPVVVFILSIFLFDGILHQKQFVAVILLLLGGLVIAYKKGLQNKQVIKYIGISVLAFAGSQLLSKIAFNQQEFLSAFILARIGGVLAVVPFLFKENIRKELKDNFSQNNQVANSKAVAIAQGCGGLGFFLQNYAISLGNVGVVIALQGIKYVFLFALVIFLGNKFVQIKEDWSRNEMIQKVVGVLMVVCGLFLLLPSFS
jgi:uncharacterized membrane protein